jgi:Protein of unknown function (DUF2934)
MAEENERPARGRKKTTEATGKKAAPRPKSAKPAATKAKAKTTTRARKTVAGMATPTPEAIAEHAYLLWERGEPGDQTEHWLRAEAELRAA